MTVSVPYSFVPGTKAKAQEVNANFNSLVEQIDETNSLKLNKDCSNLTQEGALALHTSLTDKTDTDFGNLTDEAKSLIANMASPSDTKFIELSLGATGATYTAPANGYVFFAKRAARVDEYATMGSTMVATTNTGNWVGAWVNVYLPIKKNDTFYLSYNLTGELSTFRFVPAAGSESEVS